MTELTTRTVVRRLRAWEAGGPLPRTETLHLAVADPPQRLLVAFVRMGGEQRPWGVAWRHGREAPRFAHFGEPRRRDDVDAMLVPFARALAAHLRHPDHDRHSPVPAGPDDLAPEPQIWVPDPSHLAMFHHLAYAYARRDPDRPHAAILRLLGRAALFVFLAAQRPGQQLLLTGTEALRAHWEFPAEDVRQGHLGFLLGWFHTRADRAANEAAARDAERRAVSTSLMPETERALQPALEALNAARRAGDRRETRRREAEIGGVIDDELRHRLDLLGEAVTLFERDGRRPNRGLAQLRDTTRQMLWRGFVGRELTAAEEGREPFVPHPETDHHPRVAASAYFRMGAAADRCFAALVHDDAELADEAVAAGLALRGTVRRIERHPYPDGANPEVRWTVADETAGPLRIRTDDQVCVVGRPERSGRVDGIMSGPAGETVMTVVLTKDTGERPSLPAPHGAGADDPGWVGETVTLIGTSFAQLAERKATKTRTEGPGAWLTDGVAWHDPRTATDSDDVDDDVDDDLGKDGEDDLDDLDDLDDDFEGVGERPDDDRGAP